MDRNAKKVRNVNNTRARTNTISTSITFLLVTFDQENSHKRSSLRGVKYNGSTYCRQKMHEFEKCNPNFDLESRLCSNIFLANSRLFFCLNLDITSYVTESAVFLKEIRFF